MCLFTEYKEVLYGNVVNTSTDFKYRDRFYELCLLILCF